MDHVVGAVFVAQPKVHSTGQMFVSVGNQRMRVLLMSNLSTQSLAVLQAHELLALVEAEGRHRRFLTIIEEAISLLVIMEHKVQIAVAVVLEQLVRVEQRLHELVVEVALPVRVDGSGVGARAAEFHEVRVH